MLQKSHDDPVALRKLSWVLQVHACLAGDVLSCCSLEGGNEDVGFESVLEACHQGEGQDVLLGQAPVAPTRQGRDRGWTLYYFLRAVVTNHHRLGVLKTTKMYYFIVLEAGNPKSRCRRVYV